MCASLSYDVTATSTTVLDISIPWIDVSDVQTYTKQVGIRFGLGQGKIQTTPKAQPAHLYLL